MYITEEYYFLIDLLFNKTCAIINPNEFDYSL